MMMKIKRKIASVAIARAIIKAKKRLLEACGQNNEELFEKYQNTFSGYGEEMVLAMREKHGINEISHKEGPSMLRRVWGAFVNPFTVILFILAAISFVTDVALAETGESDFSAVIIITTMVMISGLLRFVQEYRSDKSAENCWYFGRHDSSVHGAGRKTANA